MAECQNPPRSRPPQHRLAARSGLNCRSPEPPPRRCWQWNKGESHPGRRHRRSTADSGGLDLRPPPQHAPRAAIAIEGDRIAAIGPPDDLKRTRPAAEVIDARGRVAFPGFVNLHTHTILTILRGRSEDLGGHSLYGQMYPMKSVLNADDRR